MPDRYDIFISYRHKDSKNKSNVVKARTLAQKFSSMGYSVFFDQNDCKDGVLSDKILSAIHTCQYFLLLLTKKTLDRCKKEDDWVRLEIEEALKCKKKIVPVSFDIDNFEEWPTGLPDTFTQLTGLIVTTIHTDGAFESCVKDLIKDRMEELPSPKNHLEDDTEAHDRRNYKTKKRLDWNGLKRECNKSPHGNANKYLEAISKQGKYSSALFVTREKIEESFKIFISRDKDEDIFFPLLSEAGYGKTNQICHWVEERLKKEKDNLVVVFQGSKFPEGGIKDTSFGKEIRKIIDSNEADEIIGDHKIYVFIDAINEALSYPVTKGTNNTSPQQLCLDIIDLFEGASGKKFKVIFSCRSDTWGNEIEQMISPDKTNKFYFGKEGMHLSVFNDNELTEAYEAYRVHYALQPDGLNDLNLNVRMRLKDPLILKMACKAYSGRNLPNDVHEYTSRKLFDKILDKEKVENSDSQKNILSTIAKNIFNELEHGKDVDSVEEKFVLSDEDALRRLKGEKDQMIPLLTRKGSGRIGFVYERHLEWQLATYYYNKRLDKTRNLNEQVVPLIKNGVKTEIFINAIRNILILHYENQERGRDENFIISLIRENADEVGVFTLLSSTLDFLIKERYEGVWFILEELVKYSCVDRKEITKYNKLHTEVRTNGGENEKNEEYAKLLVKISPQIKCRKLVSTSLVKGISNFQDDFDKKLHELLLSVVSDKIDEVKDYVCQRIYYEKKHVNSSSEVFLKAFSNNVFERESLKNLILKEFRTQLFTAYRLAGLYIIDQFLSGNNKEARNYFINAREENKLVLSFVGNRYTRKFMKKNLSFQEERYVNNRTQYALFWRSIPSRSNKKGEWSRERLVKISGLFSKGTKNHNIFKDNIISAYKTGDAFSYFVLERVMIIFGLRSEKNMKVIMDIIKEVRERIKATRWKDYGQMSLIYILYHLGLNNQFDGFQNTIFEMLEESCIDWTENCKGHFEAPEREEKPYWRNVMVWYTAVWCKRMKKQGETEPPKFKELIEKSINIGDGDLLLHLLDNVLEIITDSEDIDTALQLLKLVFEKTCNDNWEKIPNDKLYQKVRVILATAICYFPTEVNVFIKREILSARDRGGLYGKDYSLLEYDLSGETLADLYTHKFGNFLIYVLRKEQDIAKIVVDCFKIANKYGNYNSFEEECVNIIIGHLKKIKNN